MEQGLPELGWLDAPSSVDGRLEGVCWLGGESMLYRLRCSEGYDLAEWGQRESVGRWYAQACIAPTRIRRGRCP